MKRVDESLSRKFLYKLKNGKSVTIIDAEKLAVTDSGIIILKKQERKNQ